MSKYCYLVIETSPQYRDLNMYLCTSKAKLKGSHMGKFPHRSKLGQNLDVYVSFSQAILGPWTPNLFQCVAQENSFKPMSKYCYLATENSPQYRNLNMLICTSKTKLTDSLHRKFPHRSKYGQNMDVYVSFSQATLGPLTPNLFQCVA